MQKGGIKLRRSSKKKGYYERQYQRTADNKARQARKRIMRRNTRPKKVVEHTAPSAES